MSQLLRLAINRVRRIIWGLIVAYMLGLHNFYKGDDKTAEGIHITTEQTDAQDEGTTI